MRELIVRDKIYVGGAWIRPSGDDTIGRVNLIWPRVDGLMWPHLVVGRG